MINTFEEFMDKIFVAENKKRDVKNEMYTEIGRFLEKKFEGMYSLNNVYCPTYGDSILTFNFEYFPFMPFSLKITFCCFAHGFCGIYINNIYCIVKGENDFNSFVEKCKEAFVFETLDKIRLTYLPFKEKYPDIAEKREKAWNMEIKGEVEHDKNI